MAVDKGAYGSPALFAALCFWALSIIVLLLVLPWSWLLRDGVIGGPDFVHSQGLTAMIRFWAGIRWAFVFSTVIFLIGCGLYRRDVRQ